MPTKDWKWPTMTGDYEAHRPHALDCPGRPGYKGICSCPPAAAAPTTVEQLRRDLDELLAALEALCDHPAMDADWCRAEALLSRIKAGRP